MCALIHQAQLPKCLTSNNLSCSVSKLSGCAVWLSDWLLVKLISQQPSVQPTTGRRPGSGQPEKETPAAYGSMGRDAAPLRGGEGGGKCVTLLGRASISVMDGLSFQNRRRGQEAERRSERAQGSLLSGFREQSEPQTIASSHWMTTQKPHDKTEASDINEKGEKE